MVDSLFPAKYSRACENIPTSNAEYAVFSRGFFFFLHIYIWALDKLKHGPCESIFLGLGPPVCERDRPSK